MMTINAKSAATFGLACLLSTVPVLAAGGSSAPSPSVSTEMTITPEQRAAIAYNRGLKNRDKAWALEKKLAEAQTDKQRDKLETKIRKEYRKAIQAFQSAIDAHSSIFEAQASLGYALRKTGDYTASLEAYNHALDLEPNYTQAIEYRAEAYLGLYRLEDVKDAYLQLFRVDRERADELMVAMSQWIEGRPENPGPLDAGTINDFVQWVQERSALTEQTASRGVTSPDSWQQ